MNKKNIAKLLSILLIIGLLLPTVGFAKEVDEEFKTFTLEELVQRGIERNPSIKSAEFTIEGVDITRDRANLNLDAIPTPQFFMSPMPMIVYKQAVTLDRTYDKARDNLQIKIDSTQYDIIKKYQSVLNAKENLALAKRDLEYKKSLMDIAVLKKNMGLISDIEHNGGIQTYNIAKRTFELKNNELNKAYSVLNSSVGFSDDYRFNLEVSNFADIEKDLEDIDLQRLISSGRDGLIVRILESDLALTQFKYDFYVFNDPTEPRPLDAIGETVKAEKASLAATKDNLSESIRTLFINAQDLQKKYKDLLTKDEIDRKMHEIKTIQLDLGMITKIEFVESENKLIENEVNLIALRNGYSCLITLT